MSDDLIKDPKEILSIMSKVSETNARGLIRPAEQPRLAIKFKMGRLLRTSKPKLVEFTDISALGLEKLQDFSELQIEIYWSKRIQFTTAKHSIKDDHLFTAFPKALDVSERRDKERHKTKDSYTPFYVPGGWKIEDENLAAPPVFTGYEELSQFCRIENISFGGLGLITRFPALVDWLENNPIRRKSKVFFPMQSPIAVRSELRWSKKIREVAQDSSKKKVSTQKYRLGIQFLDPSEELRGVIEIFVRNLQLKRAL